MDQPLAYLQTRSQGFLSGITCEDSLIPGAILVTAAYDRTRFTPALFDDLEIPSPKTLHRAVDKRRAEYLAGRAVAKAAMCLLGHAPDPVTTAPGRAPLWPRGLAGSISHARGRCACLLSRDTGHGYGVDTEEIASGRSLAAILAETLNTRERAIVTQGALPAATSATLTFSAKEALFKALYPQVGRHFGFDAAELTAPPTGDRLSLSLTTDLGNGLASGRRFDIHHRLSGTHVLTWLSVPGP
ncbi:4'-phosphopantetheinyl transferase superfamily protein [Marivita sp.]|uniref:4'-phosphopantetheinyl transferase family protein n=1 Tax=Marivita sp. TaxID=2003365 RepID=UPI0025C35BCB|nr:4'-phosphopantetheinyl transferase superfamily protein [Marivita sp.]